MGIHTRVASRTRSELGGFTGEIHSRGFHSGRVPSDEVTPERSIPDEFTLERFTPNGFAFQGFTLRGLPGGISLWGNSLSKIHLYDSVDFPWHSVPDELK